MASWSSPCAACKFLRRKCTQGCVFAPHFPADQPRRFENVHRVFGASNVAKLLNELGPAQREDTVNSLSYEADMRLRDPVYGSVGHIFILQHRLRQVQYDLDAARKELAGYVGHNLFAPAAAAPDPFYPQNYTAPQQQELREHELFRYDGGLVPAAQNYEDNMFQAPHPHPQPEPPPVQIQYTDIEKHEVTGRGCR